MSDSLRSNSGCWTCRVRRKKCDEANPTCLTCASLHLPCYGYGPKPAWMDRGVKEREIAKSLRKTVKQTLSLQRLTRLSSGASRTLSDEPAPPPDRYGSSSFEVSSADDVLDTDFVHIETLRSTDPSYAASFSDVCSNLRSFGSHDGHSSHQRPQSPTPAAAIIAGTARNEAIDLILTNESWSVLPLQFEEDQASLLMHFFDHVLPLQFRFYNPSILEGGRGWLLSILTRTKPLYYVALSLAAFHQQSILVRDMGIPCTASLAKLQERHIESIKVLRCHLENFPIRAQANSCEDNIEIMACITLLIALELFTCDTNDWQMHLQAASTLSLKTGREQLKKSLSSRTHKLAMAFFTGVITWYDILSCASTGLKPFSNFDDVDEDVFSQIYFDKLMGCENWAMRLILEIATLGEWKRGLEASGGLSTWELVRRAADIEMRLETGLIHASEHKNRITPMDVATTTAAPDVSASLIRDITRIFASAALVYLQVIISGPHPEIPEIRQGVSRTMVALDALTNKDLVRNLLWPVCITGCMATVEHEPYWRDLVSNVSRDKWSFGYPAKVLEIMEECWSLRRSQPGTVVAVDWMTAMNKLDMRVLLV